MDLKEIINQIENILTKEQENKIADILLNCNEKRGLDEILDDNVCIEFQYYKDDMGNIVIDVEEMVELMQEKISRMVEGGVFESNVKYDSKCILNK